MVAVTSGGTIPERGLYGVFLGEGGPRVGELDEEMVYESRPGETFVLGASTWRIERITPQQVIVSPAPGEPGKTPFWHGDAVGRPVELGRALGEFSRRVVAMDEAQALALLHDEHRLDELAARNLLAYLAEQKEATGTVPSDRAVVVERFRDELGDWRVCVLSPFGGRVHAPWALAIGAAVRERLGIDLYAIWTDDGIALRLPEGLEDGPILRPAVPGPGHGRGPGGAKSWAARRCLPRGSAKTRRGRCSLPRRRGDARTPLWQMRQRAADLLAVASRFGSFPILLETYRECLQDVFDLPALQEVLRGDRAAPGAGEHGRDAVGVAVRAVAACSTTSPSSCTRATRRWPKSAPRRWRSTANGLRELLGQEELRELLDPSALAELELELQWLGRAHGAHERPGARPAAAARATSRRPRSSHARSSADAAAWLARARNRAARRSRCASAATSAGSPSRTWQSTATRWACSRRAGAGRRSSSRDLRRAGHAAGCAGRARTRRSRAREPGRALGVAAGAGARRAAAARGQRARVLRGEFRPGGTEREWCDPDVLRSLRRRSLARLRREVEAVPAPRSRGFCPPGRAWAANRAALDRLLRGRVAARRGVPAVVDLGARRAAGAGARLPAAAARRAVRQRRSGVGGARRRSARTTGGWRCCGATG